MPENASKTLFGQAFAALAQKPAALFRQSVRPWVVYFTGEGGQDVGGLFREQLDEFCHDLQSPTLGLFTRSANGQHSIGAEREIWVVRASATSPTQLAMFEFLGRLIGVALRTENHLNVDFSPLLWKFLVGERATTDDLHNVDAMCMQSLSALRTIDQQGVTDESFEDVFMEV